MKLKWLDFLLIGLTIIGCVCLVRVQAELAVLQKQHARIRATYGEMKIEDPDAVHIKAIDSKHPWQWTWRVYLPDNAQGTLTYRVGQGSSGSLGFGSSKQLDFPDDKPIILFKRLFLGEEDANGRTLADPDGNGVVIWIE